MTLRVNGVTFCVRKPKDIDLFIVIETGPKGSRPVIKYTTEDERAAHGVCEYLALNARELYHNSIDV